MGDFTVTHEQIEQLANELKSRPDVATRASHDKALLQLFEELNVGGTNESP